MFGKQDPLSMVADLARAKKTIAELEENLTAVRQARDQEARLRKGMELARDPAAMEKNSLRLAELIEDLFVQVHPTRLARLARVQLLILRELERMKQGEQTYRYYERPTQPLTGEGERRG